MEYFITWIVVWLVLSIGFSITIFLGEDNKHEARTAICLLIGILIVWPISLPLFIVMWIHEYLWKKVIWEKLWDMKLQAKREKEQRLEREYHASVRVREDLFKL